MSETEIIFGVVIGCLVFFFLLILLLLFLVFYQKKKRNYILRQHQLEAEFKTELIRVQHEIQQETIKQIGYELHDNIGQLVTVAKIHLQNMMEKDSNSKISQTYEVVSKALEELRRLSKTLDVNELSEIPFEHLIITDQNRINSLGTVHCDFLLEGNRIDFDQKDKIILYRMAQEILTNALKHAQCTQIDIALRYELDKLILKIHDNGKGFDPKLVVPNSEGGSGLFHLNNRSALIGAQISIDSSLESGSSYLITYPFLK